MTYPRLLGLLAAAGVWSLLLVTPLAAADNPLLPGPPRPGLKTNSAPGFPRLAAKTNSTPALTGARSITNAPAASAVAKARSGITETFQNWRSNPAFYPVVICLALALGVFFLVRVFGSKPKSPAKGFTPLVPSKLSGSSRSAAAGAIHSCNVLEIGPQARQVWQFDARGTGYVLSREQTCLENDPLPTHIVGKDWRSLFQHKLNIAWLPPENVFLRVAQLPRSNFDETLAMVELQLEKLSPMPVAQIAWSIHVLPHAEGNLQTVIVMMVERGVVEEFLGRLEAQGFLADRLELPLLDQLQTTAITEDGAWIYPEAAGGKNMALVAWWYKGVLQNLDLLALPVANQPAGLKEQLTQMAWAGELEGWLAGPPEWHLVADVAAPHWEPALRAGLEQPVEMIVPRPARELAAITARRSAQTEPRANLMPPEFTTRYHQQFVDRLWMRGLVGLGGLYLLGVAIYMITLAYATIRTDNVESQVAQIGPTYTNAIQLRDRFKVLKERQELKYAGLDCWSTAARLLPENVTLESMNFSDGRRLNLSGTAPADQINQLYAFEGDMRKAVKDGQTLFDPNKGDSVQLRVQGTIATWSLSLELKRAEVQ